MGSPAVYYCKYHTAYTHCPSLSFTLCQCVCQFLCFNTRGSRKSFILFPTTFSLDAYRYILSTPTIFKGLGVSIGVTLVGTVVSMVLTSLMAYGLSRKYLYGRDFINFVIVFSMLFSGE